MPRKRRFLQLGVVMIAFHILTAVVFSVTIVSQISLDSLEIHRLAP